MPLRFWVYASRTFKCILSLYWSYLILYFSLCVRFSSIRPIFRCIDPYYVIGNFMASSIPKSACLSNQLDGEVFVFLFVVGCLSYCHRSFASFDIHFYISVKLYVLWFYIFNFQRFSYHYRFNVFFIFQKYCRQISLSSSRDVEMLSGS